MESLSDGLEAYNPDFGMHISVEDDAWVITIYNKFGEEYARVESKSFTDALRHALHYADPLLAASVFSDYYEWQEAHLVRFG